MATSITPIIIVNRICVSNTLDDMQLTASIGGGLVTSVPVINGILYTLKLSIVPAM